VHQRDPGLGGAGAARAGFAGLVLACEPTGHRWKPLVVTARAARVPVVCVQPLLVRRAREGEDFTRSRSDFGDAAIIARLTAELRCYLPYLPEGAWVRRRHLGARPQRVLWASTSTKDPDLPDTTYYLSRLAAPGTTRSREKTLLAFADHGSLDHRLDPDYAAAERTISAIAAGVDADLLAERLQRWGAGRFGADWAGLLAAVRDKAGKPETKSSP
jgi:hypothetical protein